jgi:hypothetical protein
LHARSRPPCALRVRDEFLLLDAFLTHGLRMGQGLAVREKIQQVRCSQFEVGRMVLLRVGQSP